MTMEEQITETSKFISLIQNQEKVKSEQSAASPYTWDERSFSPTSQQTLKESKRYKTKGGIIYTNVHRPGETNRSASESIKTQQKRSPRHQAVRVRPTTHLG